MGTWSISPETGVQNPEAQDGKYIFTPPKSGEVVYTITYTDGEATGEMQYVVKSTDCYVNPCANELNPPDVTFTDGTRTKTVSSSAGNTEVMYDLGECWELIGTTKTGNVTNVDGTTIYYSENFGDLQATSTVTYKFKNEIANITASSFVTLIQQVNPCRSESCPVVTNSSTGGRIGNKGGDVDVYYTETQCWVYDTKNLLEGNGYATLPSNTKIHVEANRTSATERPITVEYIFKNNTAGKVCNGFVELIQDPANPCDLDHNCPTLQQTSFPNVNAAGETITVNYSPSVGDCWSLSTTKGGDTAQIGTITTGVSSTTIVINPNTDGSSKTMTVTFTFTNSTSEEHCEGVVTITQMAGCVCSDITFTYTTNDVNFPISGINWTKIGELSVTKNGCIDSVGVTSITEGLSVRAVPNGSNKKNVEIKIDAFAQYQETVAGVKHWVTARKLYFKTTLNGEPCGNEYELYQQAFRGTDNGADVYANGEILSDPIFFVGNPDNPDPCAGKKAACRDYRQGCTEEECDKRDCAYGVYRRNGGRHDADSIRCEGGAYFVDETNPLDPQYHKIDANWDGVYLNENGVVSAQDAWLFVDASCDQTQTGGKTCTSGMCNVGMIRVRVMEGKNNTGDRCRMIRFKLASEPDPNKPPVKILKGTIGGQTVCHDGNGNPLDPPHAGEECAREWYYDIVQIPDSYYLCNYDDMHPEIYTKPASEGGGLIPLTEPCDDCNKEAHGNCKCEKIPGTNQ